MQAGKHHKDLKQAVGLQDLPCWHSDPCRHTKQTKTKKKRLHKLLEVSLKFEIQRHTGKEIPLNSTLSHNHDTEISK